VGLVLCDSPRVMTTRLGGLALSVLVLLNLSGCQAELATGLPDDQASALVVALDQAGIAASRETDGASDPPSYHVDVAPDDVADALAVMRAEGLPREVPAGLGETFGEGSLVPTPTEERARLTAALAGELSRSIEEIEGVLVARVHLALPETETLALDAPPPEPRASVMIRYRGDVAPYDESAVRRLVAGAIDHMSEGNVAIVGVGSPPRPELERRLSHIGPIAVTRGSATMLKLILGGSLLFNVLIAGVLGFVLVQRRRKAEAPEEPAPRK
jgi:type III secretion protein J